MGVAYPTVAQAERVSPFKKWLLQGYLKEPVGPYEQEDAPHQVHPWWKVMCLTGVDYFSTLGYQPGIAALAAGYLSPLATLILVVVTLFGALPIYRYVAKESPHGDGSIAMLEGLLTWWQGKLLVLVMLGFIATDFIITITLSAADATAHVLENPFVKGNLHFVEGQQVPVTLCLIALLGAVFLKGFKEAVGLAVVLVLSYLALNAVVVFVGIREILTHPTLLGDWTTALNRQHGTNPFMIVGMALLVFPKLALGLSGFETGVVVMPLVKGDGTDTPQHPTGRIRNTRKLLVTAAIMMSLFLLGSSVVTTTLIPHHEFERGGAAYGRALAYIAHRYLGDAFGTVYDASTILILWFAGASAMAGLLNIVPRFLPRYGMAPEWTRAIRPLVLLYMTIAVTVTLIFHADVEAQGGAYATGVLVLIMTDAFLVTLSVKKRGLRGWAVFFSLVTVVFVYTTVTNVVERPDGLKIASFFIGAIVLVSILSRVWRVLELRVERVDLDVVAKQFVQAAAQGDHLIRIIPNRPEERTGTEYAREVAEARRDHMIPESEEVLFLEVYVPDASTFSTVLKVRGVDVGGFKVLRAEGPAVPNAIAALLLQVQRVSGKRPHAYFNWTEGSPVTFLFKYLLAGRGDVAPLTREILRREQPDPDKRPVIHAA
jgi:hypothetical protein